MTMRGEAVEPTGHLPRLNFGPRGQEDPCRPIAQLLATPGHTRGPQISPQETSRRLDGLVTLHRENRETTVRVRNASLSFAAWRQDYAEAVRL